MGIRASEEGFKQIQAAIADRGWARNSTKWPTLVIKLNTPEVEHPEIDPNLEDFSQSSWQRFVNNKGVSLQTFRWCCRALDLNPEEIRSPDESSPELEEIYIQRPPLESQCDREIQQPGALVRVRGPRQLGKTRLLCWLLEQARQRGDRPVFLDMQTADDRDRADLTTWLQWFCRETARSLQLDPTIVAEAWDLDSTPKNNCSELWLNAFLKPSDRPLVVALDNVDLLFNQSWAKDFFGLIRGWFDKAKNLNQWKKVRFILSYSGDFIEFVTINQSPFNIGYEARLFDFSLEQTCAWVNCLGLSLDSSELTEIIGIIGGHPYLLNLTWQQVRSGVRVRNLVDLASTPQGIYSTHLHELYELSRHVKIEDEILKMLETNQAVVLELTKMKLLEKLGLGVFQGHGITWRCAMYRDFFAAHLIRRQESE